MTAQPLLYVHGAGAQKPAKALKQELDLLLFGQDQPASRIAHYSDVRWPPAGAIAGLQPAGPSASKRAARDRAVRQAEKRQVSPKAAAAAIVAASLAPPAAGPSGALAGAAGGPVGAAAAALSPDAVRLVTQLYRRADNVAKRSSTGPIAPTAGISFPDIIFRRVVGIFASDVVDYLYGGFKEKMRAPVRQALLAGPPPKVILAHSLGTIILYDVLSEPAFAGFDVQILVTAGSPLGIGNVQSKLRDAAGRPNPVPAPVKAWTNFADRWDPVALEAKLRNEFSPKPFATDEAVNNPAKNNHDLTGYLSVTLIRDAIVAAVGS